MNTLVSSTTTLKPPSRTLATGAFNTSWLLNASSNLLLPFSALSLLYVKRTCPSPSFTLRTLASISSPTLATVVKSKFWSLEYSFLEMIPSALYPIFKMISSSFTSIIVPWTTSPFLIVLKLSSSIWSKLISAMLSWTSLIILFGVEAPAVIPSIPILEKSSIFKSFFVCI